MINYFGLNSLIKHSITKTEYKQCCTPPTLGSAVINLVLPYLVKIPASMFVAVRTLRFGMGEINRLRYSHE